MSLDDQLAAIRRQGNIRSYNAIIGIMGSSVVDSLPLRVRCECSVTACEEIIDVSLAQRRELRRDYPRGFIVVLPHAEAAQDVLLHQSDEFGVVEKPEFTEVVKDL
jgi:hypothetical protein